MQRAIMLVVFVCSCALWVGCNDNSHQKDAAPTCGNGIVEANESCDDGNTVDGDGCSATCDIESPADTSECGNGVIEEGEACDDGNDVSGDGCEPDCTFSCSEDGDCAVRAACQASPTCDTSTHTCTTSAPLDDGTPCENGTCLDGECITGCIEDADCDAGDACHEHQICDASHTCVPGPQLPDDTVCDDTGVCRDGTCTFECQDADDCQAPPVCAEAPVDCVDSYCDWTPSQDGTNCVDDAGDDGQCQSGVCIKLACGDDRCDAPEDAASCPADCSDDCGDGFCTGSENAATCPADCPDDCGDGFCTGSEDNSSCPDDCAPSHTCGDGTCDADENAATCPADCPDDCGDGFCTGSENAATCHDDCGDTCGDGFCTGSENADSCHDDCPDDCGDGFCTGSENAASCPADCSDDCGDGFCTGSENAATCHDDCGDTCGDGFCTGSENADSCHDDCPDDCGDGFCTGSENAATCHDDCGDTCGDGFCTGSENYTGCPADCAAPTPRTCTAVYTLSGTLKITGTTLNIGNGSASNLPGELVLRYTESSMGSQAPKDGQSVEILHYFLRNKISISSSGLQVDTVVDAFTPTCDGVTELPDKKNIPLTCSYANGPQSIVKASGSYDGTQEEIAWDACDVPSDYENGGAGDYTPADVATGPGCLNDYKSQGNVICTDNSLLASCSNGNLQDGDNIQDDTWNQPLPAFSLTADGQSVSMPDNHIPNAQPSVTYNSFTGTRSSVTCE